MVKMKWINVRLGRDHILFIRMLSRYSGESQHTVFRVLLAVGMMRLRVQTDAAGLTKDKKKPPRGG